MASATTPSLSPPPPPATPPPTPTPSAQSKLPTQSTLANAASEAATNATNLAIEKAMNSPEVQKAIQKIPKLENKLKNQLETEIIVNVADIPIVGPIAANTLQLARELSVDIPPAADIASGVLDVVIPVLEQAKAQGKIDVSTLDAAVTAISLVSQKARENGMENVASALNNLHKHPGVQAVLAGNVSKESLQNHVQDHITRYLNNQKKSTNISLVSNINKEADNAKKMATPMSPEVIKGGKRTKTRRNQPNTLAKRKTKRRTVIRKRKTRKN
jgi:hypothetical protein